MSDEQGGLSAPSKPPAWSMPPPPRDAEPTPQGPSSPLTPPPPISGPPMQAPSVPGFALQAPDFAAFASRMGREVVRVSPVFRIAAVLILVGALVLTAENALIFTNSVRFASGASGLLEAPTNNSSASGVGATLANTEAYFGALAIATTMDVVGFSLLGAGALLLGIGSRGIEFRQRFDGQIRKPSKAILVFGVASGVCCFLWVFFTIGWRTALTGTPTGNWSFVPAMFDLQAYVNAHGFPDPVNNFINGFPTASLQWMLAAIIQVPAAAFFYGAGWGIKRETGHKIGGLSWISFSIIAMVGTILFVVAMMGVILAIQRISFTDSSALSNAFSQIAIQLAVGAATKLLVLPFWGMLSFALFSIAGLRLMRVRPGKIVMGDADIKAIIKTPSAPEAPVPVPAPFETAPLGAPAPPAAPAPPPPAMTTALSPPQKGGDVLVSLPPKPPEQPKP